MKNTDDLDMNSANGFIESVTREFLGILPLEG